MPRHEQILSELQDVLRPFATQGQEITEDTELVADLGLSSLKILDLLMEVEDRFDVSVPLNVLPDVRTVGDFAGVLEKLVQQIS